MTDGAGIPVVSAHEITERLTRGDAVAAIIAALRSGVDIESDHERLFAPLSHGEFLLMPSESPAAAGIKIASIAPENTNLGLPKIHAWYLLFDRTTLQPTALVDGTHLTSLRTPAVTAVAVQGLLGADPYGPRTAIQHLVVLGSGPQAIEHVRTLAEVLPVNEVTLIGRTPERADAAAALLRDAGIAATAGSRDALASADVIVTATSSRTPVLDLADVSPDVVIAAIGSHGLDARELDADLVRSADLVVESRASALRENGNLAAARPIKQWHDDIHPLTNLAELVRDGVARRAGHPAVYTGVGMAWEDLAVVERIMNTASNAQPARSEKESR